MGYNIEVTFNILKNGSVIKLIEYVKNNAEECLCEDFYEDYEFENKVQFQRRHCLMNINFSQENFHNMIKFLNNIKNTNGLYIECIFDEKSQTILYASQYFLTQKMDKYIAKEYSKNKRKRSYSEDDTMILNTVEKIKTY